MQNDLNAANNRGEDFLSGVPLAMAYVRIQEWDEIYDPPMALGRGTLFPELDKPFLGGPVK